MILYTCIGVKLGEVVNFVTKSREARVPWKCSAPQSTQSQEFPNVVDAYETATGSVDFGSFVLYDRREMVP